MICEGFKNVIVGVNFVGVCKGMEKVVVVVIENLKEIFKLIEGKEFIV